MRFPIRSPSLSLSDGRVFNGPSADGAGAHKDESRLLPQPSNTIRRWTLRANGAAFCPQVSPSPPRMADVSRYLHSSALLANLFLTQEQSLRLAKLTGENGRLVEELREITGDDLPEVTSSSHKATATGGSNKNASLDDDSAAAAAGSSTSSGGCGGGGSAGSSGDGASAADSDEAAQEDAGARGEPEMVICFFFCRFFFVKRR